jgi:GntR family transcriptional regulator, uxu operon transcriptional repressor
MPIQAIDSDRLYRKIARQLSDLIAAGEFSPGQRLPSERELAEQLGVSRPSVREALIALEIEGKVEVRVGSGVFVSTGKHDRPLPLLADEQHGEGPFELLLARMTVEGETAAHAASDATPAEIEEIRAAVDDLQRCQNEGLPTDQADRAFHLSIARATHNGPLTSVVELLWDQGRGKMWKQMEKHFQTAALRAATLRDHRAILEAIAAVDPDGAREAMKKHLSRVSREFARGWDLLKRSEPATSPARRKRAR